MYRVVFSDKSSLTVTDEQGMKLMQVQSNVKKPEYVNINDEQYKLSRIDKIVKAMQEPVIANKQLQTGKRSHDKSIHREIYYLYKKELEKPESRKWEEFRSAAYDYLYKKDPNWCDDRKGTCVCEDKKEPLSIERVKEVMDFMRS